MQVSDEWLERQLEKGYAVISSRTVPTEPRYRASVNKSWRTTMFNPLSFLTSRAIAAVGGALLFGATGAAAASVTTGSINPQVWGQQLGADISACKAQIGAVGGGLGACLTASTQNAPSSPSASATASQTASHSAVTSPTPSSNTKETDNGEHHSINGDPNHGQIVSAEAHSAAPGPGHGAAVSAVARKNAGHDSAVGSPSLSPSPSSSPSASSSVSASPSASPNTLPGNGHGRGR